MLTAVYWWDTAPIGHCFNELWWSGYNGNHDKIFKHIMSKFHQIKDKNASNERLKEATEVETKSHLNHNGGSTITI